MDVFDTDFDCGHHFDLGTLAVRRSTILSTNVYEQIRVIYRLIEFSLDGRSKLSLSEAPFYILEATPMFLALLLLNIYHPSRFIVGPDGEFPKNTKKADKKAAKKAEKQDRKDNKRMAKAEKKAAKKYGQKSEAYLMSSRNSPEF